MKDGLKKGGRSDDQAQLAMLDMYREEASTALFSRNLMDTYTQTEAGLRN